MISGSSGSYVTFEFTKHHLVSAVRVDFLVFNSCDIRLVTITQAGCMGNEILKRKK